MSESRFHMSYHKLKSVGFDVYGSLEPLDSRSKESCVKSFETNTVICYQLGYFLVYISYHFLSFLKGVQQRRYFHSFLAFYRAILVQEEPASWDRSFASGVEYGLCLLCDRALVRKGSGSCGPLLVRTLLLFRWHAKSFLLFLIALVHDFHLFLEVLLPPLQLDTVRVQLVPANPGV